MSKQLSISATLAVLSMAALATITGLGGFSSDTSSQMAGKTPLIELNVSR